MEKIRLAIDMMGGDEIRVKKKVGFFRKCLDGNMGTMYPWDRALLGVDDFFYEGCGEDVEIVGVGDEKKISESIIKYELEDLVEDKKFVIENSAAHVTMDGKIEGGGKRDTSLVRMLQMHRDGEVRGVFSAGETGAVIGYSSSVLGRLELGRSFGFKHKIKMPGLITFLPNKCHGRFAMSDIGGCVDVSPRNLYDLAVMSGIWYETISGKKDYKIAFLSNGEEAKKGNDLVRKSLKLVKQNEELGSRLFMNGYAEPRHLFSGLVDVAITEGFVGNIAIKMAEESVSTMKELLKREIANERNPIKKALSIAGCMSMKGVLKSLERRIDPSQYGGAPVLGVDGVVFVGHGTSNGLSFYNTLRNMRTCIKDDICERIKESYNHHVVENLDEKE